MIKPARTPQEAHRNWLVGVATTVAIAWASWVSHSIHKQSEVGTAVATEVREHQFQLDKDVKAIGELIILNKQISDKWHEDHDSRAREERVELNQRLNRIEELIVDVKAVTLKMQEFGYPASPQK